ncbi:MAG TPA: response regulator [Candidatus Sulfotelmatobacter sp.]|jgi:two-component system OmpR family response regulator|nr:response regulator [Candidatus Sulfotelmatobacter sp.]
MKTILIVDDDKLYSEVLQRELTKAGYSVLTAENGEIALKLVEKNAIQLILLDLLMPKVDGTSFYFQLNRKLKKHIPIIVLTNLQESAAYDEDIKDVLIKVNVSFAEIVSKVNDYLL